MIPKLALTAGFLFAAVSAGTLSAQSTAPAAPGSTHSTMQHSQRDSSAAHPSSEMKTHHATWTKQQVTEAQQGLAKAGFYKGKINGSYDKSTKTAIKEYQKANKLEVTGHLSHDLLTRLHSS